MTESPTEAELLACITEQIARGDDGMSVAEMMDATGRCDRTVRNSLRRMIAGKRVIVGRATRPAIDGTMRVVPVYRVK